MAKAMVLLAEGFEEIEAVVIIDVLRRADVTVTAVALRDKRVTGAHGIVIEADASLDELRPSGGGRDEASHDTVALPFDAVILPGGMPGARHLKGDVRVLRLLAEQAESMRIVAAICAAPIALEAAGVLRGHKATGFPGYELPSASYQEDRVVVDGNIVTSRGPGTAIEFALTLVELLGEPNRVSQLRTAMLVSVQSPGK